MEIYHLTFYVLYDTCDFYYLIDLGLYQKVILKLGVYVIH